MSPVVYGRNKDGSNVYFCSAIRKDGGGCGRRVQLHGSFCWQHRRQAALAKGRVAA